VGMPNSRITPTEEQLSQLARITAALGETGLCLPGSVKVRSYRCGKANCACHADPPRLHGPYIQWSRRVGAKTVHTNLTQERYDGYRALFDNDARLRRLVAELEALTLAVLGTGARSEGPDADASGQS